MVDGNFSGCMYSTSPIIKTISPTRIANGFILNSSTPSLYYTPVLLPLNENSSLALTTETYSNCSLYNITTEPAFSGSSSPFPGKIVVIPLYTLIFFLSIIGNSLVIFTLAWNRRMRTVTNVFLLNLAISDLLLGVFCMPVTLVGQILRSFVFGHLMCKIIPYFQAVSVSVGVWTLVAISLERYFAICRPLQSRKWQTRSHAYKMILAVWIFTLSCNISITFVSELKSIQNTGLHGTVPEEHSLELSCHSHHSKCKISGNNGSGAVKGTSLRLSTSRDGISNEIVTLRGGRGVVVRWKKKEVSEVSEYPNSLKAPSAVCDQLPSHSSGHSSSSYHCGNHSSSLRSCSNYRHHHPPRQLSTSHNHHHSSSRQTSSKCMKDKSHKFSRAIRSTYTGKSIESKKKVIRMLFVLVAVDFCYLWLFVTKLNYISLSVCHSINFI